jgi:glycosyltransferase involved in cell wall biosynthesis
LEAVNGIVVVTRSMKDMLRERGVPENKVLVESNGVDTRTFPGTASQLQSRERLGLDPRRRYVSFVGNFRALNVDRGLGTIVEALPRVIEVYPEVTFLFVGGPLEFAKPYITELEKGNVGEEHYMFLDRQPYNEIHNWLAASDVLVHPVPDHPIYTNITSPLKLFEYMTAERPVVASDLPSIREVLVNEETALLFAPGDSGELADAFIRVLGDKGLAKRIAKKAKTEVRERTWEARAARIKDWLEVC